MVNNCCQGAHNGAIRSRIRHLKLLATSGSLEFISMDIFIPCPKTTNGNQFVKIMINRYLKLTRAVPPLKTSTTHIATTFSHNWNVPYGIPAYVLTNSGTRFVSKFLRTICYFLGLKHLTTTAHHPQTSGLEEREIGRLLKDCAIT